MYFVCVWMCVDNVCASDSTNNSIRLQLPYAHTKLVCNKNNTYPNLPEDFIAQIALTAGVVIVSVLCSPQPIKKTSSI